MIKPATMEFVSLSNGETIAYQEEGEIQIFLYSFTEHDIVTTL